ncbi:MAG: exonuclease subunit SbcD [Chloroflexi bacterium]|nr:exonuclease subunit SbcD [Chloroflexota bacterium]
MRVIHFADAHIGVETPSRPITSDELSALPDSFAPGVNRAATYTGMPSRLIDALRALDELVDFALTEPRADLVVFSGDAYRSRDPSQTHQREFARRISRLALAGIPVFLLTGNHDVPNTEGRATALDIFDALAVDNVTVASRPAVHRIETAAGPVQIVAVPWLRRSAAAARSELHGKSTAEVTESMQSFLSNEITRMAGELDSDVPSILSAHATATTATIGHERSMMMGNDYLLLPSAFQANPIDYAALGHIHRHQLIADAPPAVYSGSLHRVDFSEENDDKGFCVVDIDPALPPGRRVAAWSFHPMWTRPFRTVKIAVHVGEQDVMGTITARLAAADVRDVVARVEIQAPTELAGDIDRIRIRNALRQAGAHVVSGVMVQVDAPDRTRTRLERGMAIESLEPEQALSLYMDKSSVATERRAMLMQAAHEIINADQMGQGADVDDEADVLVRIAEADDMEAIFALRRVVFIDEQNVDVDEEWDGRDDAAVHAVAFVGNEVVGTGRLLTDESEETCRIGRMAVRHDLRRHGIGDRILATLENAARERGFVQSLLHAQTYVKDFYAQAGYAEQGETFMEAGIEHVTMSKSLI